MSTQLNATPVMISVISDNVRQTVDFFQNLLGLEFAQDAEALESYHAPISPDGIDLMVGPQRDPRETTMVHFNVDNLDRALQEVRYNGGKVLNGPRSLGMSAPAFARYAESYRRVEPQGPAPTQQLGRMAIVQAPGGSVIGLVQLDEHMHKHFQVGRYQRPLQDFQIEHMKVGRENAEALRRQNVIPSPQENVIP